MIQQLDAYAVTPDCFNLNPSPSMVRRTTLKQLRLSVWPKP